MISGILHTSYWLCDLELRIFKNNSKSGEATIVSLTRKMLNDPESAICSFRDPSFRVGVQFVLWWPNFDIHSASRILMVLGLEETRMRSSFLSSWLSRPQIPCRSKHVLCVFPYSSMHGLHEQPIGRRRVGSEKNHSLLSLGALQS